MHRYFSIVFLIFIAPPGTGQIKDISFDTILNKVFKPSGPGATVLAAKKGAVIYKKAFGMADLELNVPMQPNMIFRVGSITKQFTAVAILQLAEQGKLSVQDEIKKYIPDYPTNGNIITIEHLMTHTSGIKSYTSMKEFMSMRRKDMNPMELIEVFKNEPMDFAPGTKWNYNNSGYVLLGFIIEKVSGKSYEQYVMDHLFAPAGMTNSGYGSENRIIKNRAKGYQGSNNNYENADYLSMTIPYAAGSLISTVEDLWKWNRALHSYKIVSKASLDKAFANYELTNKKLTNYGYGWSLSRVQGSPTIEHSGGINGFQTDAIYLPKEDIFVVIFSNCNCNPPGDMTQRIAAIVMGKPYVWKEITIDETIAKEYAGIYENEEGERRIINVEGNRLTSQRGTGTIFNIKPFMKDKFFFEKFLDTLEFKRNSSGKIEKLLYKSRDEESEWKKTDKPAPAPRKEFQLDKDVLINYVGEYELESNFIITITLDQNRLMAQATGQGKNEIFAESPTKFFYKVVDAQIEFFKGTDERVTHLVLSQNGQTIRGKKIK